MPRKRICEWDWGYGTIAQCISLCSKLQVRPLLSVEVNGEGADRLLCRGNTATIGQSSFTFDAVFPEFTIQEEVCLVFSPTWAVFLMHNEDIWVVWQEHCWGQLRWFQFVRFGIWTNRHRFFDNATVSTNNDRQQGQGKRLRWGQRESGTRAEAVVKLMLVSFLDRWNISSGFGHYCFFFSLSF